MKNLLLPACCCLFLLGHKISHPYTAFSTSHQEARIVEAGVSSGMGLLVIGGLLYGAWKLYRSMREQ